MPLCQPHHFYLLLDCVELPLRGRAKVNTAIVDFAMLFMVAYNKHIVSLNCYDEQSTLVSSMGTLKYPSHRAVAKAGPDQHHISK